MSVRQLFHHKLPALRQLAGWLASQVMVLHPQWSGITTEGEGEGWVGAKHSWIQ